MKYGVKKSVEEYENLLLKIDKSEYISFDVFDALILRNILKR